MEHLKTSFAPISGPETRVLVLGSLPGDVSIALQEYYGHPRNRFWKIVSRITGQTLPTDYDEKKRLLSQTRIGLWDVAHKAVRKGSLDTAIGQEVPNDLEAFIARHPQLEVIGFNGKKAEAMFNKYFTRKPYIRYVSLPSSSPANAGIGFDALCNNWERLLVQVP